MFIVKGHSFVRKVERNLRKVGVINFLARLTKCLCHVSARSRVNKITCPYSGEYTFWSERSSILIPKRATVVVENLACVYFCVGSKFGTVLWLPRTKMSFYAVPQCLIACSTCYITPGQRRFPIARSVSSPTSLSQMAISLPSSWNTCLRRRVRIMSRAFSYKKINGYNSSTAFSRIYFFRKVYAMLCYVMLSYVVCKKCTLEY